ncbi:YceI family protein [Nocardia higoensis]|uniref:YceI family protein n=1 Tax=Nocardia higoensis TaxID=228599 RepID=A0ABS0D6H7_9NOCA|nr:YceI family protein [Nocardia higoensis]MBF6353267.1 YceI family protein [Nocardia higoensis]
MTSTTAKGLTAGTWVIDPAHSTVGFSVRHLMVSKVRGRFSDFDGKLVIGEDGSASADAAIRVNSLTTDNEQRDAHLRSADFFHAEDFPEMTFASTGFRVADGDFLVDGELTILGKPKPVSLNVEFLGVNPGMGNGPVAGFEASTTVSRREFGLDIDMPLPDGGVVIGDKITLTLEIELTQQS